MNLNFLTLQSWTKNIIKHQGKNWLGFQGNWSFLYFFIPFKTICTSHQLYFLIDNKYDNIQKYTYWLRLIELDLLNVFIGCFLMMRTVGVGYRLNYDKINNILELNLGFSHIYKIKLLKGLKVWKLNDRTSIYIFMFDNLAILNNITSSIKKIRPLEPYKGKGLRFINEIWRKKIGKKNSL